MNSLDLTQVIMQKSLTLPPPDLLSPLQEVADCLEYLINKLHKLLPTTYVVRVKVYVFNFVREEGGGMGSPPSEDRS